MEVRGKPFLKLDGPFIQLMMSIYLDNKKRKKEWDWVKRKNDQRAVVIAATYKDKLVVIREFRVPLNDYEWGLPAGLVDDGETPGQTARREMKEETGLDIEEIYHISPPIFSSSGITDESVYMVTCSVTGEVNHDFVEDSEDITTSLFSRKELGVLIQDPNKKFGAKGYMLMQRFVEFGCLEASNLLSIK